MAGIGAVAVYYLKSRTIPIGRHCLRDVFPPMKPRIAFVVKRYCEEVVGGAELHCRLLAERLLPWFDVDVLTSCALDYLTWENHYPAGTTALHGVTVRRFACARTRHSDLNRWWTRWGRRPGDADNRLSEEAAWLEEQGPLVPDLAGFLAVERRRYAAFVFFTYLYWPTVMGLRLVADRPCSFRPPIPAIHPSGWRSSGTSSFCRRRSRTAPGRNATTFTAPSGTPRSRTT